MSPSEVKAMTFTEYAAFTDYQRKHIEAQNKANRN